MSITVTKVTADNNAYMSRYNIELLEHWDNVDSDDVDADDVPDRIRDALIDWAIGGDNICPECEDLIAMHDENVEEDADAESAGVNKVIGDAIKYAGSFTPVNLDAQATSDFYADMRTAWLNFNPEK